MRSKASHRTILALVLALAAAPFLLAQPAPAARQTFRGKVVPLAKLLEKQGVKLDPEAAPHWLALVTNEGKIHPLVRDDGARIQSSTGG